MRNNIWFCGSVKVFWVPNLILACTFLMHLIVSIVPTGTFPLSSRSEKLKNKISLRKKKGKIRRTNKIIYANLIANWAGLASFHPIKQTSKMKFVFTPCKITRIFFIILCTKQHKEVENTKQQLYKLDNAKVVKSKYQNHSCSY